MELWKKLGIGGGSLFSFGLFIGFIGFPMLIKSTVKKQMTLKEGNDVRDVWSKIPFSLDFKIFLYNVTNAAEVKAGAKPIVQQVGPFFYDEWQEKVDLVDRDEDDTIEYSNKATWIFNQEKSGPGLTEDVELVLPHVMILGLIMTIVREKPAMIGLGAKAVDSIFHKPDSVFVKTTARQILWDGLPVDCTVKDFAGTAVCSILRENDEGLIKDGESYKFALFGHKNGTAGSARIRVKRGIKNSREVGLVTEYLGKTKQEIWGEDGDCNELAGTDGTIFHPYLFEDEDVLSFSPDLCRSIAAKYQKPSKVKGLKTNRYTASLGDMSTDPELKCFCETPDTCLKKGLFDMFPCANAPIVASLPHFYDVDPIYLTQVDGLQPNAEDHEIFLDFEPVTGSPVSARKRLQFNMFVFPIEKFKLMKTFPSALLPIFWVEEGVVLPKELFGQIKMLATMLSVMGVLKYLMVFGGLGLGGGAGALYYKAQQAAQKLDITKITPKTIQNTIAGGKNGISTIHGAAIPPNLDG